MNNIGCYVALLSSVKSLRQSLEEVKNTVDGKFYEKSYQELESMKKFLEDIVNTKGLKRF